MSQSLSSVAVVNSALRVKHLLVSKYSFRNTIIMSNGLEWRGQKAEKITHIKKRLLGQAVILFNCVSFQNGNFSYRKEFASRGSEFFPLRAIHYGMENHFYHIR